MQEDTLKLKKRVNIFINNHPEWGGTFQYTQLIIKALEKKIHESSLHIYYTNKIWIKEIQKNTNFLKINYAHLFIIHIFILLGFNNIPKFIQNYFFYFLPKTFFDPKEIWVFPSQDIISILCRGKTIVSINDLMHRYSNFSETSSFLRKIYRDYKFKKISKNSYRVLVDSKLGKKHVEESYGKYGNIRIQYFSALREEISNDTNLSLGKYLIYPAQFWQHKNHTKLIMAINILKKKYSDIKLILIGHKKKKYKKINNLVKKMNLEKNILFFGFISDKKKASLISNARALINPSYLGPTNIPQLEAFNYACPVILSNVFASKEQCSDNVIYFDPNYEESIAKSIEKIWKIEEIFSLYKKKSFQIAKKYSFEIFSKNLIKNIF